MYQDPNQREVFEFLAQGIRIIKAVFWLILYATAVLSTLASAALFFVSISHFEIGMAVVFGILAFVLFRITRAIYAVYGD